MIKCRICNKSFTDLKEYSIHMKSHFLKNSSGECEDCKKRKENMMKTIEKKKGL